MNGKKCFSSQTEHILYVISIKFHREFRFSVKCRRPKPLKIIMKKKIWTKSWTIFFTLFIVYIYFSVIYCFIGKSCFLFLEVLPQRRLTHVYYMRYKINKNKCTQTINLSSFHIDFYLREIYSHAIFNKND